MWACLLGNPGVGACLQGRAGGGRCLQGSLGHAGGRIRPGWVDVLSLSSDPPLRLGLRRCELNQALTAFLALLPQL